MILPLPRMPPTKWATYLKDKGHRFPRTQDEYRLMQQAIIRERVFVSDVGQLQSQAGKTHVGFAGEGVFTAVEDRPLPLYLCLGNPSADPVPAFPEVGGGPSSTVGFPSLGSVPESLDLTLYNWEGVDDDSDSDVSDEESWLAEESRDPYDAERIAHEQAMARDNGGYLEQLMWAKRVATRRLRAAQGKFGPRSRFKFRKMTKLVTRRGPPARPGGKRRKGFFIDEHFVSLDHIPDTTLEAFFQGKYKQKKGCFNCGKTDHQMAKCPLPLKCFQCGGPYPCSKCPPVQEGSGSPPGG